MSNFNCPHCGKPCIDSPRGYVTGYEHYPADANVRGQSPLGAVARHFEQVEARKTAIREAEAVSDTMKWFYGLTGLEGEGMSD